MIILLAGIVLFIGVHSVRLAAPAYRDAAIAKHGLQRWKLVYTAISLVGLVLMVYGFGLSRANPVFLWNPPIWTRHLALPLTWLAFVLFAASHTPGSWFKNKLGHPMYAGVKVWALAHLLANGRLGDMILFGTFLVWAVAGFAISRRRDRLAGVTYGPVVARKTVGTLIGGTVVWAVFAFLLHRWLIGVPPI